MIYFVRICHECNRIFHEEPLYLTGTASFQTIIGRASEGSAILIIKGKEKLIFPFVQKCDHDRNQTLRSILMNFCTQVFWCKISISLISGCNHFTRFKMVATLNVQRMICLERPIIFENQSHQTKVCRSYYYFDMLSRFYAPLVTNWKLCKKYSNVFLIDEVIQSNYFTIL